MQAMIMFYVSQYKYLETYEKCFYLKSYCEIPIGIFIN